MPQLIESLPALPFEARKDVAQVFNNLIRKNWEGFADYVAGDPLMVKNMIGAYGNPDIALLCGSMLRECIRYESLARMTMYDETLWLFFDNYVHLPNFDVASDAFATLRDLLTRNKAVASEFLLEKFDIVFEKYKGLLTSENYVTRRQGLKLLGELLLDRSNFNVMMRYICDKENLKQMMNMLRDNSPNIQFEAFHVFKVFVANPRKPPEIERILVTNRTKLILYLQGFHSDREDEQFREEKALLISTLEQLPDPEAPAAEGAAPEEGANDTPSSAS
jgi:calcium binding protein 39